MRVRNFVGLSKGALSVKNRDQVRETAEAKFKKSEIQLLDRQKATAEYESARRAVNANTVRLRELRLARDAAVADVVPKTPAKAGPAKKRKTRKASA